MEKFNDKYRIPSARLKNYDYGSNGAYFITICVNHRLHHFGECVGGKMVLSAVGKIVEKFWYEIPEHFAGVFLGEFVVMPNHLHGILILDRPTQNIEPLHCNGSTGSFYQKISPKSGSVSTIVRSHKSVCSKHINRECPDVGFEWQTRFWDHIIRDGKAYEFISDYIINNPEHWEKDTFYNTTTPFSSADTPAGTNLSASLSFNQVEPFNK